MATTLSALSEDMRTLKRAMIGTIDKPGGALTTIENIHDTLHGAEGLVAKQKKQDDESIAQSVTIGVLKQKTLANTWGLRLILGSLCGVAIRAWAVFR